MEETFSEITKTHRMDRIFLGLAILLLLIFVIAMAKAQIKLEEDKIISIEPIYRYANEYVSTFDTIQVRTAYSCYDGISKNITCYKDISTCINMKTIMVQKPVSIIGYIKEETEIIGFVKEDKGIISKWKYDIGQRNYEEPEYRKCRQYEIDKGVCEYD
jgi:hypothetical protein